MYRQPQRPFFAAGFSFFFVGNSDIHRPAAWIRMPLGRLLEKLINPCWNVVVTASIALAMPRAEFARDKRSVHDDGNLEKHIRVREGQLFLDMFMYIVIYCNYTYCFFSSVHFVSFCDPVMFRP